MAKASEQLEGLIKELRANADKLESLKGKSESEISEKLGNVGSSMCCNACVAISPCIDLKQMCAGGCTEISFVV